MHTAERATVATSLHDPWRRNHERGWQRSPRERVPVACKCAELLIAEVHGECNGVRRAKFGQEAMARLRNCGWMDVGIGRPFRV